MKKVVFSSLLVLLSSVFAAHAGEVIVRGRAIAVMPDESSTGVLSSVHTGVSNQVVPELDLTYMVTKNIGTELILGTARHGLSSDLGSLGRVSLLPPTLTVQYHFAPDAKIRPYVGAGVNYTRFYNNDLNVGGAPVSIKKNSFGLAAQVGADVMLNDTYFLNVDVKYIGVKTKASLGGTSLGTLKVNPWVVGIGVGRKFSF